MIWALRLLLVLLLITASSLTFLSSPVLAVSVTSYPAPLPQGQIGIPYSATLTASGTAPFIWGSIIVPAWLTLTPSGNVAVLSGTPTATGTFIISVTVQDASPATTTFASSITITPPPVVISTADVPQGKEGTPYTASLSATGGTAPYVWSIISGSLPPGLTLGTTTGAILGTPSRASAGTHTFTVNVNDSSSPVRSAQMSFSIYIEKGLFQSIVSINSSLKAGSTKVYVGGTSLNTLKGGEYLTLNFDLGVTKSISVEPLIVNPTDSSVRYKAKEESITVSEVQPNAEFSYYTEYLVNVKTEPSINVQPQGSGWYREGTAVNVNTKADAQGDTGVMYKFAYWLSPSNQKVTTEQLNFTVDKPSNVTAYYDTYYKLTTESIYGEVEGSGWYKAGSDARWSVINEKVPMEGMVGFFQGKYKAVNPTGNELMDAPKTVTVFWEPDYTIPYILIPLVIVVFILVLVGLYLLLRRQQLRPQPQPISAIPPFPPPYMQPPPPRAIPQQHTTVVMIGDNKGGNAPKQLPSSTKEELMAKFGELLEKYETEIKYSLGPGVKEIPKLEAFPQEKMIPAPQAIPPQPAVDAEFTAQEIEGRFCRYAAKKLLRTVTSNWRQVESDTITLPSSSEEPKKDNTGILVIWARDIYHEWEIMNCSLPPNHEGNHQGDTQILYTLLNTITEKKVYSSSDEAQPPKPHFTDGMPQLEISDDQIVPSDALPQETTK